MPGRRNLATFFRFRQQASCSPIQTHAGPKAGTVGSNNMWDGQKMSMIVLQFLVKTHTFPPWWLVMVDQQRQANVEGSQLRLMWWGSPGLLGVTGLMQPWTPGQCGKPAPTFARARLCLETL